jgi:DNA-binding transcriptional LysR family regulator
LTSVGAALLARVKQLRLSLDDVTREIADLSEGRAGHLRIGMAAVLAHVVPMVCTSLLKEAPRLTLKLTSGDHPALVAGLRSGALDVAVSATIEPHQEDLVEEYLYDEESAIYASAKHRLANRRQLTLADLAQERWALSSLEVATGRLLTLAFGHLGLPPPKLTVETTSEMAKFHLAAASDLLTFGSKPVAQYAAGHLGIVELRVKGLSGSRRVGVRYRKDAYLPPAAFRFIEMLKAVVKDMAATKP